MARPTTPAAPAVDYVKEFEKYEQAVLAAGLIGEKSGRLAYAVPAMESLYKSFGVDKDPIIVEALGRAQAGLKAGHMTDNGVIAAAQHYRAKYDKALKEGKIGDFLKYALTRAKDVPDAAKALIERHADKKITDLDREDEEQAKVLMAIDVLRNQIIEGTLYAKVVNASAKKTLEALAG